MNSVEIDQWRRSNNKSSGAVSDMRRKIKFVASMTIIHRWSIPAFASLCKIIKNETKQALFQESYKEWRHFWLLPPYTFSSYFSRSFFFVLHPDVINKNISHIKFMKLWKHLTKCFIVFTLCHFHECVCVCVRRKSSHSASRRYKHL